jgi:dipeptidyl-peptidase-3
MSADIRLHTPVAVVDLNVEQILSTLTPEQLNYAAYLTLATWAGFPLLIAQGSTESPAIHAFLSKFFTVVPRESLTAALAEPSSPLFLFIEFSAYFYQNGSNYTGFGGQKFTPRLSRDALTSLVAPYPTAAALLTPILDALYSDDPGVRSLGFSPEGVTAYYFPSDFTRAEQQGIDSLLTAAQIRKENTIVFREAARYAVKKICVAVDDAGRQIGEFNGLPVFVTTGLYSEAVRGIVRWLALVQRSALNARQAEMIGALIRHYETGDVEDHIEYSRLWVSDLDPPVEHYHGFIEPYRDPSGGRSEWENFVAAVNPRDSEFLHKFAASSSVVLPLLPYPPAYERTTFSAPSYNAIDLLTLVTSVVPMGINLPNYDEIRLSGGFKNVTLTNVISAFPVWAGEYPFLTDDIKPTFIRYYCLTLALDTAIHELYGHGSGRPFTAADVAQGIPDLLTPGRSVTTFYADGETYQDAFGALHASYEECRAETTALHLGLKEEVLEMYGVAPEERETFRVCYLLNILHYGMVNLPMYSPATHTWTQPHAQAQFVIIRAMLIWGRGAVSLRLIDEKFKLIVDPAKFDGVYDAVERLLAHLNYYKAAKLVEPAREFYGALSSIDDFWLEVRKVADAVYIPRPCHLGVKLVKEGDKFRLAPGSDGKPNALNFTLTALENIRLATE